MDESLLDGGDEGFPGEQRSDFFFVEKFHGSFQD
jgi:hypothetical protein